MELIWTTGRASVFQILPAGKEFSPVYAKYTELNTIKFEGKSKPCPYCGRYYDGMKCPECSENITKSGIFYAGKAIAEFIGLMPHAAWLTNPPKTIDIVMPLCRRDNYEENDVILRLEECALEYSVILFEDNPSIEYQGITVNSKISCTVKIERCQI